MIDPKKQEEHSILRIVQEMYDCPMAAPTTVEKWAGQLEISYSALYEDIYLQCCRTIEPIVNEYKFPRSVVETLEILVEDYIKKTKEGV